MDEVQALRAERDAWQVERDALKQDKCDGAQEIARLKLLAKLQRMLFGQKSEKLQHQVDQLQLELEELYITQAIRGAVQAPAPSHTPAAAPARRPRPEHLPDATCCPDCGGAWKRLGEDVSEMLEYVPASLRRIRHVRPRLAH
ncbi:IS66 family transposase zinc-finger binding domain-containing protein [Pigmentiphaga sp. D-2]|uniref:IS66 family transposase zinc-finger binding domain-containing protein n=1 Tax=Pigmentiphaga sp. D-2 TaxID=1002116 RepID=UPI001FB6D042|nr:IS66 family transposase zinc-finger binding domain-containing protein [Pigmentiphaga sp. D-2]